MSDPTVFPGAPAHIDEIRASGWKGWCSALRHGIVRKAFTDESRRTECDRARNDAAEGRRLTSGDEVALTSSAPSWRIGLPARIVRMLDVLPVAGFRGLAGGMPILIGLYVGHRWGLATLGAYAFASSFAAVGLVVTDWGCARWLPRELALVAAGKGHHDAVHTANSLRLMIAAAWILLTFAMSAACMMTRDAALFSGEFAVLYLIAVASTDGVSDLIVARRTWPIAWAVAAGLAVFAVAAFVLNRMAGTAHAIVAAYVMGKAAEALLLIGPRFRLLRFFTARPCSESTGAGRGACQSR